MKDTKPFSTIEVLVIFFLGAILGGYVMAFYMFEKIQQNFPHPSPLTNTISGYKSINDFYTLKSK